VRTFNAVVAARHYIYAVTVVEGVHRLAHLRERCSQRDARSLMVTLPQPIRASAVATQASAATRMSSGTAINSLRFTPYYRLAAHSEPVSQILLLPCSAMLRRFVNINPRHTSTNAVPKGVGTD